MGYIRTKNLKKVFISFQYKDWRCISDQECQEKQYKANTNAEIGKEKGYKIFNGKCIKECPSDTQEAEENGKKTCKVEFRLKNI